MKTQGWVLRYFHIFFRSILLCLGFLFFSCFLSFANERKTVTFQDVVERLLLEFSRDVEVGALKRVSSLSVREISLGSEIPFSYETLIKDSIFRVIQKGSGVTLVHCLPCEERQEELVNGRIRYRSRVSSWDAASQVARKLGVLSWMDVSLSYHVKDVVMGFRVFDAQNGLMIWSKTYHSSSLFFHDQENQKGGGLSHFFFGEKKDASSGQAEREELSQDVASNTASTPEERVPQGEQDMTHPSQDVKTVPKEPVSSAEEELYEPPSRMTFGLSAGYYQMPNVNDPTEMFGVNIRLLDPFNKGHSFVGVTLIPAVALDQVFSYYENVEGLDSDNAQTQDEQSGSKKEDVIVIKPFDVCVGFFVSFHQYILGRADYWRKGVALEGYGSVGVVLAEGYLSPSFRAGLSGRLGGRFVIEGGVLYSFPATLRISSDRKEQSQGGLGLEMSFGVVF